MGAHANVGDVHEAKIFSSVSIILFSDYSSLGIIYFCITSRFTISELLPLLKGLEATTLAFSKYLNFKVKHHNKWRKLLSTNRILSCIRTFIYLSLSLYIYITLKYIRVDEETQPHCKYTVIV
jgi:uncharacterized membrane protein